jgi:hypothetical protein
LPRIGVTGHTNLTADTVPLVADGILAVLAGYPVPDLVGVTCLARGADQVFARAVLDLGGTLEVVLPAADAARALGMPVTVIWPEGARRR